MYNNFRTKIKNLKKIDTHEHYPSEKYMDISPRDFFDYFLPYICDNLLTAGMKPESWVSLTNKRLTFEQRWEIFEPFLEDIKHTTYFRALMKTFRDCYGMQEITKDEAIKVSKKLNDENKPGMYEKINKRNNIEMVFAFVQWNMAHIGEDKEMMPVPTTSDVSIRSLANIKALSEYTGIVIYSFETLLLAVKTLIDSYHDKGYRAIKFGSAYRRKLDYEPVTAHEAEKVFNYILSEKVNGDSKMCGSPTAMLTIEQAKPLDDYLTSYMVGLAGERNMPVFFHAGIHAWNENNVEAIHVACLESLIRRHPATTFILLHCGMPFIDDAIMLSKYFANVHLNMTWCYIIDKEQSKLCIRKFIELLPISKISAFGGDYSNPQQVYGHLEFAIDTISEVLWSLVEKNEMTEDEALIIARKWFYDNPKKLLNI